MNKGDDGVAMATSEVVTLHAEKPKPISLTFGWSEIIAVAVVGCTAVVLDFLSFRASELERRRQLAQEHQQQEPLQEEAQRRCSSSGGKSDRSSSPSSSSRNGHEAATATTLPECNGRHDTAGGESRKKTCAVSGGDASVVVEVEAQAVEVAEVEAVARHKSRVLMKRAYVLAAWIGFAWFSHRLGNQPLARFAALVGCFVAYLPHLVLSSKYRRDWALGCILETSDKRRSVADMLVWTSFVYILPTVYGLYVHQYGIAILQLFTTAGSTLFHLTRETKFFNLDNVFATSLLLTTMWALFLAVRNGIWWYVAAIGVGGPFAIFCIVRCGMPGLVCRYPCGHGLLRRSNPEYDFFHMLWHLSSGLGTLVSIHFFEVNFPAEEAGGGWFHYFPDIPVVPTVSLAISAMINFYGNRVGVMPLP